jgi:predicted nucleic acid-binding protein
MHRSTAPSLIVIDASALVELLLQTPLGLRIDRVIGASELIAPDIINPEVIQSLRGLERGGRVTSTRATKVIVRLAQSSVSRVPTTGLTQDAWSMRANLSAYDACYVALARALDCPLLTTDAPLQRAPRLGVTFLTVT